MFLNVPDVLIRIWILKFFKFCAKNFRCNLLKNPGAPLANRSAPGSFSSTNFPFISSLLIKMC